MLTTADSMQSYFEEALQCALKAGRLAITPNAKAYLVQLLAEFSRADKVFAGTSEGKPVFALMLQRAQESDPAEALRIYKHLGDSTLYLTGFFAESVHREIVSRDYYLSIGESAYASAANLARSRPSSSMVTVFEELARQFRDLVELLEAMSLHAERQPDSAMSDEKLLKLIERYQRTGSREVLEALMAHGVVLRPGMNDDDREVH